MSLSALLVALLVDALTGEPAVVYDRIPHPAVLMGRAVARLDRTLNRDGDSPRRRRSMGALAVLILVSGALGLGWGLHALLSPLPWGFVIEGVLGSALLAQRSLLEHVAHVSIGLRNQGLSGGRRAVSMIVGRDPDVLDEAGVARAAVESCAENYSDGVVAPAFWFAVLGLPGLLAYKVINTADSMIGHRSPRHLAFGWAAARLDDLVNLPASRLAALTIIIAAVLIGGRPMEAIRAVLRDAPRHRSPNAGWPEAATAGSLGFALAGPRRYAGVTVDDGWMGNGRSDLGAADIDRTIRLILIACGVLWGLAASLSFSIPVQV